MAQGDHLGLNKELHDDIDLSHTHFLLFIQSRGCSQFSDVVISVLMPAAGPTGLSCKSASSYVISTRAKLV